MLQIKLRSDPVVCRKVFDIASRNLDHPYTIRYHYWYYYAQAHLNDGSSRRGKRRRIRCVGRVAFLCGQISEPLETEKIKVTPDESVTVPTMKEILRVKGILILRRNATRDYLDFAALAHGLGSEDVKNAMSRFDEFYPQKNGESALMQLQTQLANPLPFDLEETNLSILQAFGPPMAQLGNGQSSLHRSVADTWRRTGASLYNRVIGQPPTRFVDIDLQIRNSLTIYSILIIWDAHERSNGYVSSSTPEFSP
ncbi:MAG: hypothetical protein LBS00_11980 [Synergistaceae bacterium]|jgi:hypothetical protein|nr:hypothetical protein [Synergistaceae bacterium]